VSGLSLWSGRDYATQVERSRVPFPIRDPLRLFAIGHSTPTVVRRTTLPSAVAQARPEAT